MGGTWRIGGIADYWSKLELGWHVSPTAEPPRRDRDGRARARRDRAAARPHRSLELVTDPDTGEIRPIALVTDNGPCFKSVRFAAFIDRRPELIHIRTRRKSPGQNGVRERAFGSLEVRAPLPARDRRRPPPRPRGRDLPRSSSTRSDPTNPSAAAARSTSTSKPINDRPDPQAKRARNPANFLKRDNTCQASPSAGKRTAQCAAMLLCARAEAEPQLPASPGGVHRRKNAAATSRWRRTGHRSRPERYVP